MFWDRYTDLCYSNGKTPTGVIRELGISSSQSTAWKNGANPQPGTLRKITEYFNIDKDYFEEEKKTAPEDAVLKELSDLRDCERALLHVTKGMTIEQVFCMTQFAKSMKGE